MAFGVVSSGFAAKAYEDIKADLEADFRATFGPGINLTPQSNFGQLIAILADRFADLWQLAEGVYNASFPDGAAGVSLDNLAALTGSVRAAPTLTKVTGTACGDPGTVLASGRVASITAAGYKFETVAGVTIAAVAAWATSTTYGVIGTRVTANAKVYELVTAGISAGAGTGPSGTGQTIADGSCVWKWVGNGTAAVDVQFKAQSSGPIPAYAGTLTVIETPVSGWSTITNLADHTILGTDLETDAAFRNRREEELRATGNAATEPVRQHVLAVDQVTDCYVFENPTDAIDADGIPPHAIEVLANGGADASIRQAIWDSKAAGIATYGGVTGTLTDSQGITQTVKFSRPTYKDVYVSVTVYKFADKFPADGVNQIKQALVDYAAANYRVGSDVVSSALAAKVFAIPGIKDVPLPLIGLAPAPGSSATIVAGLRELARLDTSRITVTTIDATP